MSDPTPSHDDLRQIVQLATYAPSVHNTQPWRFELGASSIDVFADRSRQLDVLDPSGRQLIVSCGAAVQHAEVAARSLGYAVEVQPFPSDDVDHLARLTFSGRRAPDPDDAALAAVLPERHTHREAFDSSEVPPAVLEQLERDAAAEGAWVQAVTRRDDLVELAVLEQHAEAAELRDPAYRAELAEWVRSESGAEGVPAAAVPAPGDARHADLPVRSFRPGSDSDADAGFFADAPAERPLVIIIGTDGDDRYAWLAAGRALGRVLLRVTVAGLGASPLNQALDLPASRTRVREALNLSGHPQMVLRIGHGAAGARASRRAVDEVVTDGGSGSRT